MSGGNVILSLATRSSAWVRHRLHFLFIISHELQKGENVIAERRKSTLYSLKKHMYKIPCAKPPHSSYIKQHSNANNFAVFSTTTKMQPSSSKTSNLIAFQLPGIGFSKFIRSGFSVINAQSRAKLLSISVVKNSSRRPSKIIINPSLQHSDHSGSGGSKNNGKGDNSRSEDDDEDNESRLEDNNLMAAIGTGLVARSYYRNSGGFRRPPPGELSLLDIIRRIRISQILLVLNIAVFAAQSLYNPALLMNGAKVNSAIAAGEYYRLISPMFLHGSISHLLVNSFSLNSTGPSVESWFGKKRFLSVYLISGICGNLLSYMCNPSPAVGASGAIFGLVGATAVMLARHNRLLGPRARRGLQSLAYIVIINFGMGLSPGSRIDNFGHLGGFLGGIAYSYLLGPRLVVRRGLSGKTILVDEPISTLVRRDIGEKVRFLKSPFRQNKPKDWR